MKENKNMKYCDNHDYNLETGKNYYHGTGVKKNYRKAAEIFGRLAEQGDTDAQNYLGVMYKNGQGVKKDYVKAAEWFRKAAYWTKKGVYLRSWIFNMKTLFERSNRYKRLNKMIAKVTDPKLKSSLIKTRDEYWNRIQKLNKPNFTDEDYNQIKQEHERMDDFISKMEKLI